jgi:hypothetical protein
MNGGRLTGLISSEWLTLRSRRLVRWLTLLAIAAILGGLAIFAAVRVNDDPMALRDVLLVTAFFVMVFGLIIGASNLGAPWGAGTIGAVLTWEPRRIRVLLVRLGVTALVIFGLTAALQALFVAPLGLLADGKGMLVQTQGAVDTGLRIALVATIIGVMAGAVATIGRSTVAALATSFVYLAIVEAVIRLLVPDSQPFLLGNSIVVFVGNRVISTDPEDSLSLLTPMRAGITLAVFTVVFVAVAAWVFRERDVT